MTSISLNQTESEKRLHRILYYLKFLRASMLRWFLIIPAIVFYMAFGITDLDPMAKDLINVFQPYTKGPELYLYIYWAVVIIAVLGGIAGVTWLYKSIVRVWRKSLKAISIVLVIVILSRPSPAVQQFLFSYNHLDPLFTLLFGMYSAFFFWWFADISIGLWKVSTSPDVYSFVATLDPRLTTGIWAHFNKLLDLPRTPLRSWRTGLSYLLSLGSYILLIVCLWYFISFGGVPLKLNQLYSARNHNLENNMVGIGAMLRSEDGYTKINSLVRGGPAQMDGTLKVGDRITAVAQGQADYIDVREMRLDKVIEMIRGEKGTRVRLLVIPADATDPSSRKNVELVRDDIKLKDQDRAQSSAWAKQIGLWLILAFIGMRLAILVQSSARKLGSLSVGEALGDSKRKYILYLRSFTADEIILPKPRLPLLSKVLFFRPFPVHLEEELFDVTDGYLPLIAVGRPGETQKLTGGLAYRDYLKDENWQTYVRDKIQAADSIVILLNSTGGVLWELENVLSYSAFAKTIFLIDPRAKDNELWQNLTKRIIPIFAKAGVLTPDFQFSGHPIGFYFSRDRLVEIENTNWSATSYRTALSHYLSERARA